MRVDRFVILVLCVAFLVLFAGCSGKEPAKVEDNLRYTPNVTPISTQVSELTHNITKPHNATKLEIIRGLLREYSNTSIDGLDVFDLSIGFWRTLKIKGIDAKIVIGDINEKGLPWYKWNYSWILAEVQPGKYVVCDVKKGTIVPYNNSSNYFYSKYRIYDPREVRRFLDLQDDYNEIWGKYTKLGDEYNTVKEQAIKDVNEFNEAKKVFERDIEKSKNATNVFEQLVYLKLVIDDMSPLLEKYGEISTLNGKLEVLDKQVREEKKELEDIESAFRSLGEEFNPSMIYKG
ncbi:hypothetical protein DRP07_03565 [Archaeoglobales archaeon]|nr:MAG: hypothetical protein DRP07_03565 [Archaeoglobales archaeon]